MGKLRLNFQKNCLIGDLKKASRLLDFGELYLMGHQWPKVMEI
jgi:hypothetical protein